MRFLLLIKNNLKRSVVTAITLVFLVSVAMSMILVSLNSIIQMDENVQNVKEITNSADISVMMPESTHKDAVEDVLGDISSIKEMEREDVFYFGDGSIKNESLSDKGDELPILIEKNSFERKMSKAHILEKVTKAHKNGAYLPYYLKVAKNYKLGDTVKLSLSGKEYKCVVDGFYEEINFANPSNFSTYMIFVSDNTWDEIESNATVMNTFLFWRGISFGNVSTDEIETEFTKSFNEKYDIGLGSGFVLSYDTMKVGATMFPNIIMGILLGLAGVLLVIAIVVIRFQIVTYIQQNYKNIGVMEATGYTTKDMILVFVGMFTVITVTGVLAGEIISVAGGGAINFLLGLTTGLQWQLIPNVALYIMAAVFMLIFVALVSFFASLKIRKITVLNALRDGINTHNFKRNYFAMEKTPLPLNFTIALKGIMAALRQNVSIVFIVCLLSFSVGFSFVAVENFNGDSDSMWSFIGMEKGDVQFYFKDESIKNDVNKHKDIESILEQISINTTISSSESGAEQTLQTKVSPDFKQHNKDLIVEGRYPEASNEISLTTLIADKLDVGINDVVSVLCEDVKQEYIVVGITQQTSNLGRSSALTLDGAKRISPDIVINTGNYILKEGVEVNNFVNDIYKQYGNDRIVLSNLQKIMKDIMTTYSMTMNALCIVMLFITIIVVTLILYLLVSVKVLKERRNFGVAKACGYTTGQLIVQILCGFMPQIVIGCIIGAVLAMVGTNPLVALSMSSVGFKKCTFTIPVASIVGVSAAVIILALLITIFTALRIRKITPAELIEL